eukprot:5976870-Prymnesium_polylepis.2
MDPFVRPLVQPDVLAHEGDVRLVAFECVSLAAGLGGEKREGALWCRREACQPLAQSWAV